MEQLMQMKKPKLQTEYIKDKSHKVNITLITD